MFEVLHFASFHAHRIPIKFPADSLSEYNLLAW